MMGTEPRKGRDFWVDVITKKKTTGRRTYLPSS